MDISSSGDDPKSHTWW